MGSSGAVSVTRLLLTWGTSWVVAVGVAFADGAVLVLDDVFDLA
jgi:hypothetical protein